MAVEETSRKVRWLSMKNVNHSTEPQMTNITATKSTWAMQLNTCICILNLLDQEDLK